MSSIRNIAVGLPVRDGRVLVLTGFDSVKGEAFHRAIGGGIEFGETAEAALRREFMEELGVMLDAVNLVSVSEDIFEYEGEPGHHVAHIYSVQSAAIDSIPLDAQLQVLDEGSPITWVRIADATLPFYPEGVADALEKLAASSPPVVE